MSDIGYNDNIIVGDRTFHIQTATNKSKGVVRCEVFERGRLITTRELKYERRRKPEQAALGDHIHAFVKEVHLSTVDELKFLFKVAQRINKAPSTSALIKLGLLFLKHNLIPDAIQTFKKVLSIEPSSNRAMILLASTYIKLNRNDAAIDLLERVVKSGYSYADVYNKLGLAHLNKKNFSKSLNYFQEALRINPSYGEAQYNAAIAYLQSVLSVPNAKYLPPPSIRIERAKQLLQKVSLQNKGFQEKFENEIDRLLDQKNLQHAIEILHNQREQLFPMDTTNLISTSFYLKFMYDGVRLTEKEIKQYEQELKEAIEQKPDYADLWNSLGIVHLIQCRNLFLQALNEFDRALEINPAYEKALKNKKLVENDGKEFLILLRAILK